MTKPTGKRPRPLTNKQLVFVQEYLIDMNATAAAKRAGYSLKTANEQAVRLMADDRIQKAIQEEINKRRERLRVSADDVLLHIMEGAFLDITKYVEWDRDGRVIYKGSDELGIDGRFIKSIKGKTQKFGVRRKVIRDESSGQEKVFHETIDSIETEFEFELLNKEKLLDLLFRHFGLGAPLKVDENIPFALLVSSALEAVRNVTTEDDD